MTKKTISVLVICALGVGSALAGPTVSLTRISGYYSGSGGEFQLTPNQDLMDLTSETGPYPSFCLEYNEKVSMGGVYDVSIATEAILGGNNDGPAGPLGGDPLDPMTAYLYTNLRAGALAGYDYDPLGDRAASAGALQEVIWYIEDEAGKGWTDGDDSLQDQFYALALGSGWTDLGKVRVLNLYAEGHLGDPQYHKQDQLALVPAPGAVLMAGFGIGLLSWFRRSQFR